MEERLAGGPTQIHMHTHSLPPQPTSLSPTRPHPISAGARLLVETGLADGHMHAHFLPLTHSLSPPPTFCRREAAGGERAG